MRVSMLAQRVPSFSGDRLLVLASLSGDAAMEGRGGGRGGGSWFYNTHDMDKKRVRIHELTVGLWYWQTQGPLPFPWAGQATILSTVLAHVDPLAGFSPLPNFSPAVKRRRRSLHCHPVFALWLLFAFFISG